MQSVEQLHQAMLDSFLLARDDYAPEHKSKHWDIFAADYEKVIVDALAWRDFRRNGITARIDISPEAASDNLSTEITEGAEVKSIRRRVDSLSAVCGVDFIRRMHEGVVGNPPALAIDGMRITTPELRLIHDAWRIHTLYPQGIPGQRPVIVEIGGGYGGLAVKLKHLFPNALVVVLDLPEVNAVQHYYVCQNFPDASVADYATYKKGGWAAILEGGYDFAVLPGWAADTLPPESVDLAINTRSMMEMNRAVVDHYMAVLNRAVKVEGIFYCVNRYAKWTVGENIRIKDYPFDERWYLAISQKAWDQPWIHELAAVRTARPNSVPPNAAMAGFEPHTAADLVATAKRLLCILRAITWGGHHNVNPGLRGWLRLRNKRFQRVVSAKVRQHPGVRRFLKTVRGK